MNRQERAQLRHAYHVPYALDFKEVDAKIAQGDFILTKTGIKLTKSVHNYKLIEQEDISTQP